VNTETGIRADDPVEYSHDEATQLAGYQSPSALAIAGLLLGLASPLCVLGLLLWAVPLVGVAVSLAALRRIAASDGALSGRPLAVAGLVLSTAVGCAVVSHATITQQLRGLQAAEVGRHWIALVLAGDTQSAYQLAIGYPPPDPNRTEDLGPEGNPYDRFVEGPVVTALLAAGTEAEVRDQGTIKYAALWGNEFVLRRRYLVTPRAASGEDGTHPREPIPVLLQMRRAEVPGKTYRTWRVTPLDEANLPEE
jgi:hypothetical protein